MLRVLSSVLLTALPLAFCLAQKPPQPVQVSTKLTKPDSEGRQLLTVKIAIEKGWHIYANPAGAAGPSPDHRTGRSSIGLAGCADSVSAWQTQNASRRELPHLRGHRRNYRPAATSRDQRPARFQSVDGHRALSGLQRPDLPAPAHR
jgi:hypothetical protein